MEKSVAKSKLSEVITRFPRVGETLGELSEQDITTKFVLPMLASFNWGIYKISEKGPEVHEKAYKEKGNVHGGLPDIVLTSENGTVFVEVKKPPLKESHTAELQKYKQSDLIVLTSFQDLKLYTRFGEQKPELRMSMSYTSYLDEFDRLWSILSNSEEGKKSRAAYKATAHR